MTKKLSNSRFRSLLFIGVSILAIFIIVANINAIQYWLIGATGQPARIIVDVNAELAPLPESWRSVAQGGESSQYRFAPVVSKLQDLGVRTLRLDHIYDFYNIVSRSQNGQLQYDFSRLDPVLQDLRNGGATPFISLSYMPPAISQGDIVDRPRQWSEWQQTIAATINHISGVNNLAIPNVYYEVWNEPDLFGQWKTYGDKNYLDLYYYAVKGAESVNNTLPYKIGGPATTALYDNWITRLFDFVDQNNLRLDFYSWHRYTSSVERYNQDLIQLGEVMAKYPKYANQTEYVISEWGIDSNNNVAYDSKIAAAHLVAVASQISPYLTQLTSFEFQDGLDPNGRKYWGRWGMLTHQDFDSTPKPRYQAMQLLNRMSGKNLGLIGNGSWVKAMASKTSNDAIQLIMANYDPNARNAESVPVTLKHLPPGNYILSQEILGIPISRTRLATQDSGDLVFTVNLQANDVVLLTLNRSAIQ